MEFSCQEHRSGLPFPAPGDLPNLGVEPVPLASAALAGGFFTPAAPGKSMLCTVVVAQSQNHVRLFATSRTATYQALLSSTISRNLLRFMSIESVMPFNHLILCHPFLWLSIFPSIRVSSSESALHIRWPKYCSVIFNISPSNEYSALVSFGIDCFVYLQFHRLSRVFCSTTNAYPTPICSISTFG